MAKRIRRLFSTEFKLEVAQLVFDQHYSVVDATNAIGAGKSIMDKWVWQLKLKRKGISTKASFMTPELVEIREFRKKIARLEEHN
ncbi:TPA: transposase [Proteus mirabilis]|nr:transposase [Proteus mirabilis]HEJ9688442.1 transposase [Proteus mirabilis]HEK0415665.1 transposase [Proteus mirabilis]HEK0610171.1 transposase [Proteus mirabilis]HEK2811862.1 transposase [Proteus mirabilis]